MRFLLLCLLSVASGLCAETDWSFAETPKVVAKGREWWVAPKGDDDGPGTKQRPFATITKALSKAEPGDTVQVRKGRYDAEKPKLNFARSGRADAWIVLQSADGPGEAEIDGKGEAFEVMLIHERSYVVLDGLYIHGSEDNALHVGVECSYVIVRDCRVRGAEGGGDAIKVNGSDHVYVEGCDVSDAGDELIDFMGCHHCVSRGNFMHDLREGKTATFAKGGSHEILFERNVVVGVRKAHAIMLGGDSGAGLFAPELPDIECENMLVRNNIVVDCDDSAFEVRGCRNGWILHNTAVGSSTTFASVAVRPGRTNDGGVSSSKNIVVMNNLFWNDGDHDRPYLVDDACREGLSTGWNLWWNGKARVSDRGGIDVHDEKGALVDDDPRLVSTAIDVKSWKEAVERFGLRAGSPAIRAGTVSPLVTDDILGKRRGRPPCMGASER